MTKSQEKCILVFDMNVDNKVGLVVVRLGAFDPYIDFWISSAAKNERIDFLIFTDNKAFKQKYDIFSNIKITLITKEDIQKRIQSFLGFLPSLERPYKLCDYRPAFGLVFANELKKYDYWGFCDTDLIFGDIWSFIKDKLYKFDRLYNLGHLNIFRNSSETNRLFFETNSIVRHLTFEMAAKEEENIYFDEFFGNNLIWDSQNKLKQYKNPCDYADIDVFSYHLRRTDNKKNYYYEFINGKLFEINKQGKREILYVHLQKRKMKIATTNTNHFVVLNCEFVSYECNNIESMFNCKHPFKSFFYLIRQKIKYYSTRYKRKKYVKTKAKTEFYKICY